jgi:hypothetical protein
MNKYFEIFGQASGFQVTCPKCGEAQVASQSLNQSGTSAPLPKQTSNDKDQSREGTQS